DRAPVETTIASPLSTAADHLEPPAKELPAGEPPKTTTSWWASLLPASIIGDPTKDSHNDIGWTLGLDPEWKTRVRTAEFDELYPQATRGRVLPANANDFAYLLVPGLFTKHYPGYFRDNVQRLKARGITSVTISRIDTDARVDVNAAIIAEEVKRIAARTG